jgi:hypothetical protein
LKIFGRDSREVVVKYEEALAKLVVEAVLEGASMRFREDQSISVADFDLTLPSGETVPLEVSQTTDEALRKTVAAIEKKEKGGQFIQGKVCSRGWLLIPRQDANINRIRKKVDRYLANIESVGLDVFSVFSGHCDEFPAVKAIVDDLGIESGRVFEWIRPRLICIQHPCDVTMYDASVPLEAAMQVAEENDNRKKLGAVEAMQRHMFVYVDWFDRDAWFGMNSPRPYLPTAAVELPEEVTDLWIASRTRVSGQFAVWRATKGGTVKSVGPIAIDTETVQDLQSEA